MIEALSAARAFLAEDPDPETREELNALLARAEAGEAAAKKELDERFGSTLRFGTAGLRGEMGAGTARMNRLMVIRATWGLGTYLLEQGPKEGFDAKALGVAIGFDGRKKSRRFAEDAAAVLVGLGIPVYVFRAPVPTPLCGFVTKTKGLAAGVQVTASHNPPRDNGYKVYWRGGAQIVPPHDAGIAACIDRAPPLAEIARPSVAEQVERGLRTVVGEDVEAAYLKGVRQGSLHPGAARRAPLRIAYTALHGVGNRFVLRALEDAGFDLVATEPLQADPDGAFPTVRFPNPEEEGALDLVLALAKETRADLVLANDPDADRIAVCVLDEKGEGYVPLSGNDIGVLLGADHIEHMDTGGRKKVVVTTLVSSTMLSRIARDLGADYEETLTGFKWIAKAAREREARGDAFVFGYEEALGVCPGSLVWDKDGISGAVRVAELCAHLKAEGKTLLDRLEELYVRHGLSRAAQWSVMLPGAEGRRKIDATLEALRKEPPGELAGVKVVRRLDLSKDAASSDERFEGTKMPPADVLVFFADDGTRLTVRPSGTEPKVKFYLELEARVKDRAELEKARRRLDARLEEVKRDVMERLGLSARA